MTQNQCFICWENCRRKQDCCNAYCHSNCLYTYYELNKHKYYECPHCKEQIIHFSILCKSLSKDFIYYICVSIVFVLMTSIGSLISGQILFMFLEVKLTNGNFGDCLVYGFFINIGIFILYTIFYIVKNVFCNYVS